MGDGFHGESVADWRDGVGGLRLEVKFKILRNKPAKLNNSCGGVCIKGMILGITRSYRHGS
jgi:hypothetical protein